MTKLKKFLLGLSLAGLFTSSKPVYRYVMHDNIPYKTIMVPTKLVPTTVSVNGRDISVEKVQDLKDVRYPTDPSPVCYAGPGIGGLLIVVQAAFSAPADYNLCKAAIIMGH